MLEKNCNYIIYFMRQLQTFIYIYVPSQVLLISFHKYNLYLIIVDTYATFSELLTISDTHTYNTYMYTIVNY